MSYSKKIYIRAIIFLVSVALVMLLEIGFSTYFSLRDVSKYNTVFLFILGFLGYPLIRKLVNWVDSLTWPSIKNKIKDAKNGRRGFEGEDMVNSWLEEIVGKDNFVSNVYLPNKKFDIDAVALGSRGVIMVEVKNYSDPVRFENDEYYEEKDGRLIRISPDDDPRLQTRKNYYALRNYLDENGLSSVMVRKVLIFVNGLVSWDGNTGVFIAKDKDSLFNYWRSWEVDPACTPQICEKIKTLLSKK